MGILFFGGLWFTVKKALVSKKPVLWFLGSLIIRVGIALLGFYYFSLGKWYNMLICLLGFVVARYMVMRLTKTRDTGRLQLKKGN